LKYYKRAILFPKFVCCCTASCET